MSGGVLLSKPELCFGCHSFCHVSLLHVFLKKQPFWCCAHNCSKERLRLRLANSQCELQRLLPVTPHSLDGMNKSLFFRLEQRNRVAEIEERRVRLANDAAASNPRPNAINLGNQLSLAPSEHPEALEQPAVSLQRPSSHVSNYAISLGWLFAWVRQHPQIRSQSMSTGAVVYDIIKPEVKEAGCRYVDLISERKREWAISKGKRYFFISHGWGRPFMELVEQLRSHFKSAQAQDVFVWLDIFAINQNEGSSQGDDLAQLKEVVEDAEQTLMILDKEGSVLTRIWCLFEAWHTGKKGPGNLRLLSYGLKWTAVQKVFLDLDVSKAKATVEEDKERILKEIDSDVGILTMTHQLKNALVDSTIIDCPTGNDYKRDMLTGQLFFKAAGIANMYGRFSDAEPLYRKAHECYEAAVGPDHAETMKPLTSLAILLKDQGRFDESESLFQRSLSVRETFSDNFDVLTTLSLLAELYVLQGRLEEAQPLYERSLEGRKKKLGDKHPYTLITICNLACVHRDMDRLAESRALFKLALEGQAELGAELPRTLIAMCEYGELLRIEERLGEACNLQRQAWEGLEKVIGSGHPDALLAAHRLALVLIDLGKAEEAVPFCVKAWEGRVRVLGAEHRHTAESDKLLEKARAQARSSNMNKP